MTTLTMIKLLFVLCIYIEIIVSEGPYMTGLLHEGIFHVGGLIKPAIFGSSPWAYVMCN